MSDGVERGWRVRPQSEWVAWEVVGLVSMQEFVRRGGELSLGSSSRYSYKPVRYSYLLIGFQTIVLYCIVMQLWPGGRGAVKFPYVVGPINIYFSCLRYLQDGRKG